MQRSNYLRTTLTLDEQLAKDLQEYARRTRQSFKDVVNQALNLGLKVMEQPVEPVPYRLKPVSMGQVRVWEATSIKRWI